MPTVYGMLGQATPAAATLTPIYTVPASKHATVKVVATNRDGSASTFKIAVCPAGAAIANGHYIAYDVAIDANDSLTSAAITVAETDLIRVESANGLMTFNVTGIEEDD